MRRLLLMAFREAGLIAHGVDSCQEALAMLDAGSLDAVVLDLHLADGRATALLDRLRQGGEGGPRWIATSALDYAEVVRQFGPVNGAFIPKPFDPWEIVGRVEEMLGQGPL